ncbi:hypothetical protein GF412_05330 [Candidatus Micrarchaeota archaeon]|nr:hypothetical protein [Candidatus Micrarchaeota archaeon]MBD3418374.1 hypothetical protein [Candidatus Micrarchaeota archaeon]
MAKKEEKEGKKPKNNYGFKAAGFTLLIVVLCIGIFFVADALVPVRGWHNKEELRVLRESYLYIMSSISSIMFLISAYLVFIYLKDYLVLRSRFTLGILLAVVSFMLFAISSNPLLHVFLGVFGKLGLFSIIPMLFATISLGILAWVSSK